VDYEQRINMKFCFKLQKKSGRETHELLKLAYGDAAVTTKTVYKWFERFRNGCISVEDEERSRRPSTSKTQENVGRVSEMIRSNRRTTIGEISEDLKHLLYFRSKHFNYRFEHNAREWQRSVSRIVSGTAISVK
jgi:transposase